MKIKFVQVRALKGGADIKDIFDIDDIIHTEMIEHKTKGKFLNIWYLDHTVDLSSLSINTIAAELKKREQIKELLEKKKEC